MKTYGNLQFLPGPPARWKITELAPHVAIALKRLFTRVPQTAVDILLTDTDELRTDLAWFMSRYPLAHDAQAIIEEGCSRVADRAAERERILLPNWAPGEVQGFKEGREPYPYQVQAARLALHNPGLLLGDEVGLGKTISAAATITMGAPLPAAIVVQAHLAGQWATRIEEFTNLRTHIIKGTKPYDLPAADVYIFRYSNIAGWTNVIAQRLFPTVVYDEIQELRHGRGTAKGSAAAVLSGNAQVRMGLTATPIYNYGDEIHAVMAFLQQGLLGSRDEFMREWCAGTKVVRNPDGLGSYLRDTGYFLRRTEDDDIVSGSMPPTNVVDWEVGYDQRAADGEEALTRQLAMTVLQGSFVAAGQAARELDAKMRQITGIAKARSVAAYVRLLLEESDRVLLAGWHREVYSIWQDELAEFQPVLYSGSESAAGKQRSVERFTTGPARVMMISLRSGAGLDGLQGYCNDIVFGELDWSPQVHHQVIGRLRRPGQPKQVTAHYLHTSEGSDPVLLETLGVKSDQARGINSPGVDTQARFSDDSRIRRLAAHVLDQQGLNFSERAA
ncbi:SNF2-related protein [Sphingomonas sp. AX6]|uniref:SNF2-related protein n=1 Tax=Sphingomonas sp. AX6 TaxID=2653171 RepID=UPI0012EFE22B|nr:DEAD/DEAH box helicase [Sphingomonas sp. AX6]VXC63176.1 conserved hypothetical protein [Sphingomonas sp. AX6]